MPPKQTRSVVFTVRPWQRTLQSTVPGAHEVRCAPRTGGGRPQRIGTHVVPSKRSARALQRTCRDGSKPLAHLKASHTSPARTLAHEPSECRDECTTNCISGVIGTGTVHLALVVYRATVPRQAAASGELQRPASQSTPAVDSTVMWRRRAALVVISGVLLALPSRLLLVHKTRQVAPEAAWAHAPSFSAAGSKLFGVVLQRLSSQRGAAKRPPGKHAMSPDLENPREQFNVHTPPTGTTQLLSCSPWGIVGSSPSHVLGTQRPAVHLPSTQDTHSGPSTRNLGPHTTRHRPPLGVPAHTCKPME